MDRILKEISDSSWGIYNNNKNDLSAAYCLIAKSKHKLWGNYEEKLAFTDLKEYLKYFRKEVNSGIYDYRYWKMELENLLRKKKTEGSSSFYFFVYFCLHLKTQCCLIQRVVKINCLYILSTMKVLHVTFSLIKTQAPSVLVSVLF